MGKTVIIGAGPIGLYLAIKLKIKGVSNMVVYDPRAGCYTRPGQITYDVFAMAEQGICTTFWPKNQSGQIKDIERMLFSIAAHLQIPIEKKKFVGFSTLINQKGVCVESDNRQEYIPCDYIFDCTGAKRKVINAVNALQPESPPFLLIPIIKQVPVKHHIVAYVKMSPQDRLHLENAVNDSIKPLPEHEDLSISQLIIENINRLAPLKKLGWKKSSLPRCYGFDFKKDKICLYLEAPDNLLPSMQNLWINLVLKSVTGSSSITFTHLPQPKKYDYKPRITYFKIEPMQLNCQAYEDLQLPTIIAQGDTQIDANYFLAHGLIHGFARVNKLIDSIEIKDQQLSHFFLKKYQNDVQIDLDEHKKELMEHYGERLPFFKKFTALGSGNSNPILRLTAKL